MLILESQGLKIIKGTISTWCKDHEKYNILWEVSETTNVTVDGTQSYYCSVN